MTKVYDSEWQLKGCHTLCKKKTEKYFPKVCQLGKFPASRLGRICSAETVAAVILRTFQKKSISVIFWIFGI